MITFSQFGKYGRLGNQLFQYAAIKSISLETGYKLKIPNINNLIWHNQICQMNLFNIECDFLKKEDLNSITNFYREMDHTKFYQDVFNISDNTDILGYFQNFNYFKKHFNQIKKEFKMKKELTEFAKDYVNCLKDKNEKIVSVHIRRGDMTDGTNPEYANYYGENDVLTRESPFGQYFFKALDQFNDINCKFLIFSGGSRAGVRHNQSDIMWCKENLKEDRYLFSENNNDIEDFAIMKSCDHHITTHMTSFGYWAALLNDNEEKIVIAPKNYTIPDDNRVKEGFYPSDWRII